MSGVEPLTAWKWESDLDKEQALLTPEQLLSLSRAALL